MVAGALAVALLAAGAGCGGTEQRESPSLPGTTAPAHEMTLEERWRACLNDPNADPGICPDEGDYPPDPDYYFPEER
jgi:hypothetical protein